MGWPRSHQVGGGGEGGSKAAGDGPDTEDVSNDPSSVLEGGGVEAFSSVSSSPAPSDDGVGGGESKRKMSNKEKFEFTGLETAIDTLSQRGKELEGLLAEAQDSGSG